MTIQTGARTWRYTLVSRIFVGVLAAAVIALGLFFVWIPFGLGPAADPLTLTLFWIIALFMLVFGTFLAFGYLGLARTHLTLDATALRGVVPVERGWRFAPRFRSVDVPLTDLRAVERRVEIVRTMGMSTARHALSVVTASGERIGLFSNADTAIVRLPLDEIAAAIAAAAGVAVTDRGTVISKAPGLFASASSSWNETPLDAPHAAKARRGAAITMQIVFGLLALTWIVRACTVH